MQLFSHAVGCSCLQRGRLVNAHSVIARSVVANHGELLPALETHPDLIQRFYASKQ